MAGTSSGLMPVRTSPLIRAAGPWSHIPVQEVSRRLISPSAVVSPRRIPSAFSKAAATLSMSCILSTTQLERRTVYRPAGFRSKNE